MKSLVTITGIILMVLAFVVMGTFIVVPVLLPSVNDAPFIRDTLQTLLCKDGETITDKHSTYTQPGRTVTTMTLSCVNNERQVREVTGQAILYGVVGYLVPFLTGLFMTIAGANRRRRMIVQGFTPIQGQAFSMDNAGIGINVDPDGKVTVNLPDGRVLSGQQATFSTVGNAASLVDRLKELKSAYDSGLITQSEYEAKHEEILKEM